MRSFTLALRLRVRAGQKREATYKAAISSFSAPLGLFKRDWSQKRCGMCGQMLPVEAFYTRTNNTHSYYCRECSVKYARDKRMFNKLNK